MDDEPTSTTARLSAKRNISSVYSTPDKRKTRPTKSRKGLDQLEKAFGCDLSHIYETDESCESEGDISLSDLSNEDQISGIHPVHIYPLDSQARESLISKCKQRLAEGNILSKSLSNFTGDVHIPGIQYPNYCPGPEHSNMTGLQPPGQPGTPRAQLSDADNHILHVINNNFLGVFQSALADDNTKKLYEALFAPLFASALSKVDTLEKRIVDLEKICESKDDTVEEMEYKMDGYEQKTRKMNLKLYGIPEKQGEAPGILVAETADMIKANICTNDFEACHRIGQAKEGKTRPILVKFNNGEARGKLFGARKTLNEMAKHLKKTQVTGTPNPFESIYINEDLAPLRSKLLYVARGLKNAKLLFKYWVYDSEVFVRYSEEDTPQKVTGGKHFRRYVGHPIYNQIMDSANRAPTPRVQKPRPQRDQLRRNQPGPSAQMDDEMTQQQHLLNPQAQQPPPVPMTGQQQGSQSLSNTMMINPAMMAGLPIPQGMGPPPGYIPGSILGANMGLHGQPMHQAATYSQATTSSTATPT